MLNVLDARTHYSALCMRVCNLDASLDVYSLRSAIHVQAIIIAAMIICKYRVRSNLNSICWLEAQFFVAFAKMQRPALRKFLIGVLCNATCKVHESAT